MFINSVILKIMVHLLKLLLFVCIMCSDFSVLWFVSMKNTVLINYVVVNVRCRQLEETEVTEEV
jgi:hypothetical protein